MNTTSSPLLHLIDDISINEGAIVSKTIHKDENHNLTLFGFDKGQALSAHSSPMDAWVQILSGEMEVSIGDKTHRLQANQLVRMPAGISHALHANRPTRMLLTMFKHINS